MAINPNSEKYRRGREPAISAPEKPPFVRFCNFHDRKQLPGYAANIGFQYWGLIRELSDTGRNKEAVIKAVGKKDKLLSHFFFSSGMTGYGLLGFENNPDYEEKMVILNELLEEEYGIGMDSFVSKYLDELKKEGEAERRIEENKKGMIEDAMKTRGEIGEKIIFCEIDKIAADLLTPEFGITEYEILTGKKPNITEFGEVLQKEVRKKLGFSLPHSVRYYMEETVNQIMRDSYGIHKSAGQYPSQSVEFA